MASLLLGTTIGGHVAVHANNISTYALTSLPSHNHDDRYFTESESDGRFQPLENQRLSTSNGPTFDNIYNNGWFRNNNANQGLYNQSTTMHWSSQTNGYWDASSTNAVSAIRFWTGGHLSAIRGYVYSDTSNEIGFLNRDGNWSLKTNLGRHTILYGNLTVGQDAGASSIYMHDSDEGTREIHCNSNRIGFLTQAGAWGSWCDDDGGWNSVGNISGNYLYSNYSVRVGEIWGFGGLYRSSGAMLFGTENAGWSFRSGNSEKVYIATDGNIYMAWAGAYISTLLDAKQNASTAINTGNIGNQSVNYAATSGGLNTTFLGNGSTNISSGYSRVIRNENGDGGNLPYAPVLHLAASDTMWQIAGGHAGSTNLQWRSGYAGTWSTPWWTILHSGNYTSYSPSLTGTGASGTWGINITGNAATATSAGDSTNLGGRSSSRYLYYRGYSTSGDFQSLQSSESIIRFDQVGEAQSWSNAPGGYTYGGVLSMRGDNFGFQIWGSHIGDLYYKTQWNNDQYSGWRYIVHSGNIGSQSVNYATSAGNSATTSQRSFDYLYTTSYLESAGAVYGTIFYDNNDRSYYVDPNALSRIDRLQVVSNWGGSTPNDGQINIRGNYPSMTFRNTISGNMWLRHMDGAGDIQHYFAPSGVDATDWSIKHSMRTDGTFQSNGSMRAPIFYDSNDTAFFLDPNADLSLRVYGEICNSNYAEGKMQPGALNIGRIDTNYAWDGGSWASDVRLGLLANTSETWEFGIHDSGDSVMSVVHFDGGSTLTMGRNLGWGQCVVNAPAGYVSNGNAWGTANSAFFPNGITTAGGTNWIYGFTYIGNAPANGNGHEFNANGTQYSTTSITTPAFIVNSHSDNTRGYRIHNTSGSSVSAMFTNSANALVIGAGAFDQVQLNKKVLVSGAALGVNVAASATAGRIDASNDIVAYSSSDERLKENIAPIENALDKVKSLTGVEFDWKPEYKHAHGYEGHDTGIIAQQVEAVMPSAVRTNDTGFLAVRYEKLIGLLIEANKELAARVEELEKKLN